MKLLYNVEIELGHSMIDYINLDDYREEVRGNIDRTLKGEHFKELVYFNKENSFKSVLEVSHCPIKAEDDSIIGVVFYGNDITERKLHEEEICRLNGLFEILSKVIEIATKRLLII